MAVWNMSQEKMIIHTIDQGRLCCMQLVGASERR